MYGVVGPLFVDMVRFQWAPNNHDQRLTIQEVLSHPAWGPLLDGEADNKRARLE